MKVYRGLISKTTLKACFDEATKKTAYFVGVKVETKGYPGAEVIINRAENFTAKKDYYDKAYNEDLTLKTAPDIIRITGFAYGNSFSELSRLMN